VVGREGIQFALSHSPFPVFAKETEAAEETKPAITIEGERHDASDRVGRLVVRPWRTWPMFVSKDCEQGLEGRLQIAN
jgi:hypothetical protein